MERGQEQNNQEPQSSQQNLLIPKTSKQKRVYQHVIHQRKDEITLENHQKTHVLALERIDPKGISATSIILNFAGCIQFAELYEGQEDLQVSYIIKWGEQWRQDPRDSLKQPNFSQFCEAKEGLITFDLPFEGTLSCTVPSSWPQLILIFKGFDVFGHKVTKGYAQMHFPIKAGRTQSSCYIYAPQSNSSLYQRFKAWLTGTSMQYKRDFQKIIIKGQGRQVGLVKTIGAVKVIFNVITRNFSSLGF